MIRKLFQQILIIFIFLFFVSLPVIGLEVCGSGCSTQYTSCTNNAWSARNSCESACPMVPTSVDATCMLYCTWYGYNLDYCMGTCALGWVQDYACLGNCDTQYYNALDSCQTQLQNCPPICPDPPPPCGDGVCGDGETFANCPADCYCDNDGVCESIHKENDSNCHNDCHWNNGTCEAALGENCSNSPDDCQCSCQSVCQIAMDNCAQAVQACISNCGGSYSCAVACSIYAAQCQSAYDACMNSCN